MMGKSTKAITFRSSDVPLKAIRFHASKKRCYIKSRSNEKNITTIIEWHANETPPTVAEINSALCTYLNINNKLNAHPTPEEFNMHKGEVITVRDALLMYQQNHIHRQSGVGSDEDKLIERLLRRYLSKEHSFTFHGILKRTPFSDMNLKDLNQAIFKSYMSNFRENNGTHDKLISRIKAACNYCIKERLISADDCANFFDIRRVDVSRHVIIDDYDLKDIWSKVGEHNDPSFRLFMLLQMYGQSRTHELLNIKVKDVNFANNTIRLHLKKNKVKDVTFHESVFEKIRAHIQEEGLTRKDCYLIGGSNNAKKTTTYIYKQWHTILSELSLADTDSEGITTYKYRLHDFRESMAARLTEETNETIASMLNHSGVHTVKRYRQVNHKTYNKAVEMNHRRIANTLRHQP